MLRFLRHVAFFSILLISNLLLMNTNAKMSVNNNTAAIRVLNLDRG